MKNPNDDRLVLTWARDSNKQEFWQIDSWDGKGWYEASDWEHVVLYWQDLPERPKDEYLSK